MSSDLGWDLTTQILSLMPVFLAWFSRLSNGFRELSPNSIFLTDPFSLYESQSRFL